MKQKFRGWSTVFDFTFKQSLKSKRYTLVTIIISFLIITACVAVNVLIAKPDNDKPKESSIESVLVSDQSGLAITNSGLHPGLIDDKYKDIMIEYYDESRDEIVNRVAKLENTFAIYISTTEEGFLLESILPENSNIKEKHVNSFMEAYMQNFELNKIVQSGVDSNQLLTLVKPAVPSYVSVGEDTNVAIMVIKMVAPMLFGFILYMMLLTYGQNVSKTVSIEKTSKLMETILTSVHPYAMITGKVLATTATALIQFGSWIISLLLGLFLGGHVATLIYPDYNNTFMTVINFIKDNLGESAFSPVAIILALLVFTLGFLYYSVLAGIAGSMVSKPEDAASTQSIFVFPILISFLIAYLAPIMENHSLTAVARYIPFTSPFIVPVDVLTGTMTIVEGLISFALLAVFTFVVILISAKLYKGFVLFHGQKFSFKTLKEFIVSK